MLHGFDKPCLKVRVKQGVRTNNWLVTKGTFADSTARAFLIGFYGECRKHLWRTVCTKVAL